MRKFALQPNWLCWSLPFACLVLSAALPAAAANKQESGCAGLILKLTIPASAECSVHVEGEGSDRWETEQIIFDTSVGTGVVYYAKPSTNGYFSGDTLDEFIQTYLSDVPNDLKDRGEYADYQYVTAKLRNNQRAECLVFYRKGAPSDRGDGTRSMLHGMLCSKTLTQASIVTFLSAIEAPK